MKKNKTPLCCKDCLKWKKFGNKCHTYWEEKTYCTRKVITEKEWNEQELLK